MNLVGVIVIIAGVLDFWQYISSSYLPGSPNHIFGLAGAALLRVDGEYPESISIFAFIGMDRNGTNILSSPAMDSRVVFLMVGCRLSFRPYLPGRHWPERNQDRAVDQCRCAPAGATPERRGALPRRSVSAEGPLSSRSRETTSCNSDIRIPVL